MQVPEVSSGRRRTAWSGWEAGPAQPRSPVARRTPGAARPHRRAGLVEPSQHSPGRRAISQDSTSTVRATETCAAPRAAARPESATSRREVGGPVPPARVLPAAGLGPDGSEASEASEAPQASVGFESCVDCATPARRRGSGEGGPVDLGGRPQGGCPVDFTMRPPCSCCLQVAVVARDADSTEPAPRYDGPRRAGRAGDRLHAPDRPASPVAGRGRGPGRPGAQV